MGASAFLSTFVAVPKPARPPLLPCPTMLPVGSPAPDFEATTNEGKTLRLSDFRGKKNVVLFFYPADFTMICTKQACMFRDAEGELASQDTQILGVSTDDEAKHAQFSEAHGLSFPLLADPDGAIGKKYRTLSGLRSLLGRSARVTYVIDKEGIIRGAVHSELNAQKHLDEVRRVLSVTGR